MLHTVKEHEFMNLMRSLETYSDGRVDQAGPAYRSLFTHWAASIPTSQVVLLGYLISRTLVLGKAAQRISIAEFSDALGMGVSSIRTHLKALTDDGFLQVYRTASGEDLHEKEPRMFAIDCNFFLKDDPEGEQVGRKLTAGGAKRASNPQQKSDTPQQNLLPPTYTNYIGSLNSNNKGKPLYSVRSSRTVAAEPETTVIPTPKKPRATLQRSDSIAAVLHKVSASATANSDSRTASAARKPAHLIDKLEMQALIDKAQKTYTPSATRMIVTGKEFGFLRKRLKDQPPQDFTAFINWVIGYWTNIAHQNRVAVQRKLSDTDQSVSRPLPMAPDFASLAYRYPYFLKAYSNHVAERQDIVKIAETDNRVKILEKALQEKDRNIGVLRNELTKVKTSVVRRTPVAPARVAPARVKLDAELPDTDDLPAWTSRNEFGARNASRR